MLLLAQLGPGKKPHPDYDTSLPSLCQCCTQCWLGNLGQLQCFTNQFWCVHLKLTGSSHRMSGTALHWLAAQLLVTVLQEAAFIVLVPLL